MDNDSFTLTRYLDGMNVFFFRNYRQRHFKTRKLYKKYLEYISNNPEQQYPLIFKDKDSQEDKARVINLFFNLYQQINATKEGVAGTVDDFECKIYEYFGFSLYDLLVVEDIFMPLEASTCECDRECFDSAGTVHEVIGYVAYVPEAYALQNFIETSINICKEAIQAKNGTIEDLEYLLKARKLTHYYEYERQDYLDLKEILDNLMNTMQQKFKLKDEYIKIINKIFTVPSIISRYINEKIGRKTMRKWLDKDKKKRFEFEMLNKLIENLTKPEQKEFKYFFYNIVEYSSLLSEYKSKLTKKLNKFEQHCLIDHFDEKEYSKAELSNGKHPNWTDLKNRIIGLYLYDLLQGKKKTVPVTTIREDKRLKKYGFNEEHKQSLNNFYKTTCKCVRYGTIMPMGS